MMLTAESTASTAFAFSDDELLDALTHISEVVDLSSLETSASYDAMPYVDGHSQNHSQSHQNNSTGTSYTVLPSLDAAAATSDERSSMMAAQEDSLAMLFAPAAMPTAMAGSISPELMEDEAAASSSEQSTTTEIESITQRAVPNENKPRRKRRKHELDAVRSTATALEHQLHELQVRHHRSERSASPGGNLLWKRVADQLQLDRQRATAENARLRGIFQEQERIIKSVKRSIQKNPDLEKLGVLPAEPRVVEIPRPFTQPDVYRQLFHDLSASYRGTDTMLAKVGIREAANNSRRVTMDMQTDDGQMTMKFQISESRALPFDIPTTGESVWKFLSTGTDGKHENIFHRELSTRGDKVFGACKVGVGVGSYRSNGNLALQRFVDGNRLSYVWECIATCSDSTIPAKSFRLRETGWAVFEPAAPNTNDKSVFRTCVQFTPKPLHEGQKLGSIPKDIGTVTEMALTIYEKTIGYMYDTLAAQLMSSLHISEPGGDA